MGPPGPGFNGTFFSDWKTATQDNGYGLADFTCSYTGSLEANTKLSELAYQNGIILVYQKNVNALGINIDRIRAIPFSTFHETYSFSLLTSRTSLTLDYKVSSPDYEDIKNCSKIARAFSSDMLYRYVLIPVPSAESKLVPSSLSSPLERAKAWYGLTDLSYASVKGRFGLKD